MQAPADLTKPWFVFGVNVFLDQSTFLSLLVATTLSYEISPEVIFSKCIRIFPCEMRINFVYRPMANFGPYAWSVGLRLLHSLSLQGRLVFIVVA